jgi:hypothetical protein
MSPPAEDTRRAARPPLVLDGLLLLIEGMASTVVTQSSVQWTPPAAPANSGLSTFTVQASHNAQNVGTLDIPSGTAPATVFNIPFGSVGKAKVLIVKSLMTSDIDVKINGTTDPIFILAPGGSFRYEAPSDPTTGVRPVISASFATLVAPTAVESVQFWVMGD